MKISELRCPACNGPLTVDQDNQNIAVCEYCGTKYMLEWEGANARIGGQPAPKQAPARPPVPPAQPAPMKPAGTPPKKGTVNVVAMAAAMLLFIVMIGIPTFLRISDSGDKGRKTVEPSAEATASARIEPIKEKIPFEGIFAEAAAVIFEKPAEDITDSELASVKCLTLRYADGGDSIVIGYSMKNPLEDPEAEMEEIFFERSGAKLKFEALQRFTGLVKLSVLSYISAENLKGIPLESISCYAKNPKELAAVFESTENIKELEIAAGLESLEGLGLFPSLEKLHLDCYGLADIRELANAKSVRELTLENGDDVKDFSVLSVMTWLEGLYIDSENLKALTFLSNMTQLKTLGIERGGLLNLNGLATRAYTLTGLTIDSCGELSDCNEVSALTGLTSLSIELPYNCKEPDLSGMTAMEELEISGFSTVSFLHSMPEIKKLKLNSSAVDDKSVFGALQKLEELKCGSFSASKNNLDFIAGLPALKKLDLTGAATYSDISAIFNMPTLEILLMDGVECEINFDKLQDNPALKTLSMDGIKLYKNVKVSGGGGIVYVDWDNVVFNEHMDFIGHYPNLECLGLADNELTAVDFAAGLGNLKTLDISENYVTDIKPLTGAQSLTTLILEGNPVDNLRVLDEKVRIVQ